MTDEISRPLHLNPIALSEASTVVAEYVPEERDREAHYQSEAELERAFVRQLERQGYEYLKIRSEAELVANLRQQLEALNKIEFTEGEWARFFKDVVAKANEGIGEKTKRIQEEEIQILEREDGSEKNIRLIDKQHVHNNRLQVINQYEVEGQSEQGAVRKNRYDVTILVNGLPLVHVELKRRGVELREAFNQIARYQRDSFWAGSGLFNYVQLFVISNGTLTKYYSNTVRRDTVESQQGTRKRTKGSPSFTFTSWWTDAKNKRIAELVDFTKTFFSRNTLLNVLTRYCIFNNEANRKLLVMRPYQIVAAEAILLRIKTASHAKQQGTIKAGGTIWHSTGSGKTLTSFKAAQLACGLAEVSRVLFVVDRKDLDHQTMREYNRFQKDAANSTASTGELKRRLEDPRAKIIITTIQKLSRFVSGNPQHPVYGEPVVIIFDECHRSQFGDMHRAITGAFRNYYLFGFTGTPIFGENAASANVPQRQTTEQLFGERLHAYTIVNAIDDKNVLPFRIDYLTTVKRAPHIEDKQVRGINSAGALIAPDRIREIVRYIGQNFDRKTKRNAHYSLGDRRLRGFNSLFAVDSVEAAKLYYAEFKRQQAELPPHARLKIGMIYSFAANEDSGDGQLADEQFEVAGLDQSSRDFLESAIQDYNALFGVNFDTTGEGFQNYYRDISKRLKERELDLVIVVNMFLTGFDATTLNTLWVDKNLRMHGLIQAYSRTNRILNSVKSYGQIVCFRDLEEETNKALELFGGEEGKRPVVLPGYDFYYEKYQVRVAALLREFPLGFAVVGEAAQRDFIKLFGEILRYRNILNSFDEFAGHEILSEREFQDYLSLYQELYRQLREQAEDGREDITDDLIFEVELIKQVEVNVDYILMLIEQYIAETGSKKAGELRDSVMRAVLASPSLRSKKDLIEQFLDTVSPHGRVDTQWQGFIARKRAEELDRIIAEESLKPEETRAFMGNAFRDGAVPTVGLEVTKILPPISPFSEDNGYTRKKQTVLQKLAAFLERYLGLG